MNRSRGAREGAWNSARSQRGRMPRRHVPRGTPPRPSSQCVLAADDETSVGARHGVGVRPAGGGRHRCGRGPRGGVLSANSASTMPLSHSGRPGGAGVHRPATFAMAGPLFACGAASAPAGLWYDALGSGRGAVPGRRAVHTNAARPNARPRGLPRPLRSPGRLGCLLHVQIGCAAARHALEQALPAAACVRRRRTFGAHAVVAARLPRPQLAPGGTGSWVQDRSAANAALVSHSDILPCDR